jgi:hypothetical protein
MNEIRSMRLRLAAALVVAALFLAGEAGAYRMIQNTTIGRVSAGYAVTCTNAGGFTHWSNANIAWYHNTANQGSGKTAALQAAMASWTGVSNASHTLTYAGTTSSGWSTDGRNTLLWANGNGCTGSCLALTALVLASGQRITETDVTFNNAVNWTTNGNNYDTQAVATHELGHTLGIHHTNLTSTPRPTMYAYYFGSGGRSLETDDRSALQCAQNRYPPASLMAGELESGGVVDGSPIALAARPQAGGAILRFGLLSDDDVKLQVFDVSGRVVATLVDGRRPAGEHEVHWDGTGSSGRSRPGVYFARLVTSTATARATVIRIE